MDNQSNGLNDSIQPDIKLIRIYLSPENFFNILQ